MVAVLVESEPFESQAPTSETVAYRALSPAPEYFKLLADMDIDGPAIQAWAKQRQLVDRILTGQPLPEGDNETTNLTAETSARNALSPAPEYFKLLTERDLGGTALEAWAKQREMNETGLASLQADSSSTPVEGLIALADQDAESPNIQARVEYEEQRRLNTAILIGQLPLGHSDEDDKPESLAHNSEVTLTQSSQLNHDTIRFVRNALESKDLLKGFIRRGLSRVHPSIKDGIDVRIDRKWQRRRKHHNQLHLKYGPIEPSEKDETEAKPTSPANIPVAVEELPVPMSEPVVEITLVTDNAIEISKPTLVESEAVQRFLKEQTFRQLVIRQFTISTETRSQRRRRVRKESALGKELSQKIDLESYIAPYLSPNTDPLVLNRHQPDIDLETDLRI